MKKKLLTSQLPFTARRNKIKQLYVAGNFKGKFQYVSI